MKTFKVDDCVRWSWGEGVAKGVISKIYTERVEWTIKGTEVVRNADNENPAFLIRQDDGDEVLKSATEIEAA